jgi:hypothetical protein
MAERHLSRLFLASNTGVFMSITRVCLLSIGVFFSSTASYAEQRQHGTHVHGEGELLVVLEEQELEMSFRIPGMDIIGFEHVPKTEEQKESIKNAKAYLRNGEQVFELTDGAECELQRASALFALTTHDHHDDEQSEVVHSDEKEKNHNMESEKHAEFHVKYKYKCSQPKKLESIGFNIFEKYGGIEKVKTAFIIFSEQSSATLTADDPEIRLKKCRLGIGSWCLF